MQRANVAVVSMDFDNQTSVAELGQGEQAMKVIWGTDDPRVYLLSG